MSEKSEYDNKVEIQWCPGCPNFGILEAFKKAFADIGKKPHEICLVSGIGQAAKLPHYLRCNVFNGLHGRAIPVAVGIQSVNPELTTMVVTGDGDCYGEGGNHFIHALRRNPDITLVVHNNEIYALTKGQASPTTKPGEKRTLQVDGVLTSALNPLAIAIIQGCTFVARGFAGEPDHLSELLAAAIRHPGFSYVDIIQPCITWGNHSVRWFKDRVYQLDKEYDANNRAAALEKVTTDSDRMPIGILYRSDPKPPFGQRFRDEITDRILANQDFVQAEKIGDILERFKVNRDIFYSSGQV